MRRFFIEKSKISKDKVIIAGKETHHIKDVIRLKQNDKFIGLDGEGSQYICRINTIGKDRIEAIIENAQKTIVKIPPVGLACAIPKAGKMDYIVQKAAELGAKSLIPVQAERTEVRLNAQKANLKIKRWEKIAKESSKQCGRDQILKITELKNFSDVVKNSNGYKIKLIACLCADTKPIKDILSNLKQDPLIILIGPEGDFTSAEVCLAIDAGFIPVSLGTSVLRVDTAAIFSLSVIMYELFLK